MCGGSSAAFGGEARLGLALPLSHSKVGGVLGARAPAPQGSRLRVGASAWSQASANDAGSPACHSTRAAGPSAMASSSSARWGSSEAPARPPSAASQLRACSQAPAQMRRQGAQLKADDGRARRACANSRFYKKAARTMPDSAWAMQFHCRRPASSHARASGRRQDSAQRMEAGTLRRTPPRWRI